MTNFSLEIAWPVDYLALGVSVHRTLAGAEGHLVARYFMQLRSGTEELLDPEGSEYPSLAALRDAVLFTARDVLTTDVRLGFVDLRFRIDAEDEAGIVVHTLGFEQAVSIRNIT